MLAENEVNNLELKIDPIAEPGYHLSKARIDRYTLWLERWGVLPDELDRQDRLVVEDIEMRAAMKSQAQREYWKSKEPEQNDGSF